MKIDPLAARVGEPGLCVRERTVGASFVSGGGRKLNIMDISVNRRHREAMRAAIRTGRIRE
jgi:hypothetical protein